VTGNAGTAKKREGEYCFGDGPATGEMREKTRRKKPAGLHEAGRREKGKKGKRFQPLLKSPATSERGKHEKRKGLSAVHCEDGRKGRENLVQRCDQKKNKERRRKNKISPNLGIERENCTGAAALL